jgi:hypothetical protein
MEQIPILLMYDVKFILSLSIHLTTCDWIESGQLHLCLPLDFMEMKRYILLFSLSMDLPLIEYVAGCMGSLVNDG